MGFGVSLDPAGRDAKGFGARAKGENQRNVML
jgi:hypothetical protein